MKTLVKSLMMLAMAAPASVLPVVAQQTTNAAATRGHFGFVLSCSNCTDDRAEGLVTYTTHPWISDVTRGGPAERAGIRRGDTLLAADGLDLLTPEGSRRFAAVTPGQSLRLTVRRNGRARDVTVVLGTGPTGTASEASIARMARDAERQAVSAWRSAFRSPMGWLGMGLECEECSVSFGLRPVARFRNPPVVLTVDVDGPAHRGGLRRGDTLLAIDGMDLTTTEGGRAFAAIDPGQRVTITARRQGRERHVRLIAVARPDASPEEVAAYEAYRRGRDSVQAEYRESVTGALQLAQAEMRALEQYMRAAELDRLVRDSTSKRLTTIDSALRVLRSTERRLAGGRYPVAVPAVPPSAAVAPAPPAVWAVPSPAPPGAYTYTTTSPLRYSGRLGDLVNVEARAPGAVNVSEVGDSLIVVTAGETVVRIVLRPDRRPAPAPAPAAAPEPAAAPRPARPARP